MARVSRRESRTRLYHVVARGNNGEKVFRNQSAKQQFLLYMEKGCEAAVELIAYCIMDDHVHLLIRADLEELSRYMHGIKSQYAMYYNHLTGRTGHVFQGRYESECIEKENCFWSCLRYIHNNPVQAGISREVYRYPYSSAQEYLQKKSNLIHLSAKRVLKSRCRTQKEFLDFHKIIDDCIFIDMTEEQQKRKCAVLKAHLIVFLEKQHILLGEFLCDPYLKKSFEAEIHKDIQLSYKQIRETFELIYLEVDFR